MKTALKPVTKDQARRMQIIAMEIGCAACWVDTGLYVEPEIHHLLDTGRRRGHEYTIGLCHPHHQGKDGIHRAKRAFRTRYGSDGELLQATNDRIAIVEGNIV